MPICVLREQLADYDAWKAGFYAHFDANAEQFRDAGVVVEAVYRDADDPNTVLVMHRFGSREQAEAFMDDPGAKATMAAAGVDPTSIRVEVYEDPS